MPDTFGVESNLLGSLVWGVGENYGQQPVPKRTFPFQMTLVSFYVPYLRWLRHLSERLGYQNTSSLWEKAFKDYDDEL
jgi:hypothetical protein